MKPTFWLAGILLITASIHFGSLRNGFYWDDRAQILEGQLIGSWSNIAQLFGQEVWHNVDLGERVERAHVDTYRPLFNVSLLIDRQVWGLWAPGFHLTNLSIHLANVGLLFFLLLPFGGAGVAAAASLFFGLHPLAVEPVHYVSARSDSLPLLFGLSGLLLLERGGKVGAAGLFLLAALCKETGLAFSLGWFSFAMFRRRGWVHPLVALVVYFALRQSALGGAKSVLDLRHVADWLLYFPFFVLRFLRQFLVPLSNFPMQEMTIPPRPGPASAWPISFLFYVSAAAVIAPAVRRGRSWGAAAIGSLAALGIPFAAVTLTEEANPRYFYAVLPVAATLAAYGLKRLPVSPVLRGLSVTCIVLGLAWGSLATGRGYSTEERFYRGILAGSPRSATGAYNLANTLARAGRWEEAVPHYDRLIGRDSSDPRYWNNRGVCRLNLGDLVAARGDFERALKLAPGTERYLKNLAKTFAQPALPEGISSGGVDSPASARRP